MGNQVYANMMEVSCKAAMGKSICAFPDVCFTPPLTPATPPGVPIPYPNTGMASDTTSGSTSVQISGKEVMLKNKSYFKRSMGDEAGCAPKKGVVTSMNMGKVYFTMWSMDVKVEGENVVRMMDLTTHNHASQGPNAPPMVYFDEVAVAVPEVCRKQAEEANEACKDAKKRPPKLSAKGNPVSDGVDCSSECKAKQKCILVPKGKDKEACCHPYTTGDHQIEDHWIWKSDTELMPDFAHLKDKPGGPYNGAPSLCVDGDRYRKMHGVGHGTRGVREDSLIGSDGKFAYAKGKEIAMEGYQDQLAHFEKEEGVKCNCDKACTEAQLDAFYGPDPNKKELHKPERKQAQKAEQRASATARINARTPPGPFGRG